MSIIHINKIEDKNCIIRNSKSNDKIEFICDNCKKTIVISIAAFKKKDQLICGHCSQSKKLKSFINDNKEEWVDRWKNSVLEKYGVDNIAFSKENQNKKKNTCLEKYGTEYAVQSKEVRDKINKTFEKNYDGNHSPWSDPEIREKSRITMNKKYGCDYSGQSEELEIKRKKTNLEKYGVEETGGLQFIIDKKRKTNLEKYGVEENFNNQSCKEKRFNTMQEKYGCNYALQNEAIKKSMQESNSFYNADKFKNYRYDDKNFDSSYELAFYIYLKDHDENFIYQPDTPIKYIGNDNKEHLYYPDFSLNGNFIEIKGDQFFNDKGEPFNCYNKTYWWEKYNTIIDNNIQILKEKDIRPYIKYVKDTYGKDFIKKHKRRED